jgi:hypothetical protein
VILDNHSAGISEETKAWLADQPAHRFDFTFTPNTAPGSTKPVEGCFSKLARSVFASHPCHIKTEAEGSHHGCHGQIQLTSVVHTWSFKLDKARL